MRRIISIAAILFVLSVVCKAVEAMPKKVKPVDPPVTIHDIEDQLDSLQQRFAYLITDAKNLIDLDIDPLTDELDELYTLMKRFLKKKHS